jgi:hypothetical protein
VFYEVWVCVCVGWHLVTSGALSANLRVITERKEVYSPCVPFSRKRIACSPCHFSFRFARRHPIDHHYLFHSPYSILRVWSSRKIEFMGL